jgi:hypothetical protein
MPGRRITEEDLKRYGMSIAPPDDPIYSEGPLVIVGGEPTEQSHELPQRDEAGESDSLTEEPT